jgi:hypothetical protein
MDRKAIEESEKVRKKFEETARINELHDRHLQTEKSLKEDQDELKEVLSRLDERLLMMEEQILDIRKSQSHRRWFGIV